MRLRFMLSVCVAALLAGCVVRVHEPVYAAEAEVYAPVAPPAEQVEVIGVAPSPEHFWIKGYWMHRGGTWVWIGGHWERRRHGHMWEHSRWELRGGRWVLIPGHWRAI
jgi:hypothetical protein